MEIISTKAAPAAIGPYSQAIVTGSLIYTSGQIPINPASGNIEASKILRLCSKKQVHLLKK